MSLKILVVEDDPVIAQDIAENLVALGYQVGGLAYSSKKALKILATQAIDLAILDINLGKTDTSIKLAQKLNQEYLIPFIYLTAYSDDLTLSEVRETLPAGFVLKPFDLPRLKAAIEIACHTYYRVTHTYWHQLDNLNQHLLKDLTKRELELLQLVCKGLTNQELGDALFVSINTIKTHLKHLYAKLEVRNRAEVIAKVQGLI